MKESVIDKWLINPVNRFMNNTAMSGVVLFASAFLAIFLANSPWAEQYHHIWEHEFSIGFNDHIIRKSLHHWINDGLMAIFFFVVGLELKRELIAGELSNPKNAILPIVAAIGGMAVPAIIYWVLNPSGNVSDGWGIPMATDIAFALGILYLLGDKVPLSLKIFLTALAIVDDLGAVLVIAFFYTSDISFVSLSIGVAFMVVLIVANRIGVRSTLFYGIVGIGGLWLAFLMSGIHATIAAVLAAFTIPASVKITHSEYVSKLDKYMQKFKALNPTKAPTVSSKELYVIDRIRYHSKQALTPLQRLEHAMHPMVVFVIMPIFALANAGVELNAKVFATMGNSVTLGVAFGLIIGKVLGIAGLTRLLAVFKLVSLPSDINWKHIYGVAFLAAIGFTMSLFISGLAFADELLIAQAKLGILLASLVGGITGYLILKRTIKK